ncbi:hypothetical protein [Streptomyces griseoviridis]|uniref:DUF222 domain-containing protein n=1 Tax=Streptomyces griseoviridis TaxID=45398 RepID=A0ABT9LFC0_STRGD|nr:hypothetical protein [Streptomyces griseoviridis]MDP9682405.1 hypothetical protein [Streptomyces griseoviridis]GGS81709.1 hypothetical protein GCM10010240_13820 [Streptomyces griseoviridis]
MSAPLVINLVDGSVWERRAVTGAGVALYALAGSCRCPEYLMASESELAAQGIAGSADVLPVPTGPEPSPDPVAAGRALDLLALMDDRAASAVSPVLAAVLDEAERLRTRLAGELAAPLAWARLLDAKSLDNFLCALGMAVDTDPQDGALSQAEEMIRSFRAAVPAGAEQERARTLHDHIVVRDAEIERLRARVAELDAAQGTFPPLWVADYDSAPLTLHLTREAARAACDDVAKVDAGGRCWDWRTEEDGTDRQFWSHPDDDRPTGYTGGAVWQIEVERPDAGADGLTRRFAPTQALRDDEPAEKAKRPVEWCTGCTTDHDPSECGYRPESGGAS